MKGNFKGDDGTTEKVRGPKKSDSSSGDQECLFTFYRNCFKQLLRYFKAVQNDAHILTSRSHGSMDADVGLSV